MSTVENPQAQPTSDSDASGAEINAAEQVRAILANVLSLDADVAAALDADSGLFGAIPELDSMAVAGLLTELEDQFDIIIDDDEIDAEMFETFGALTAFVARKLEG